MHMQKIMEYLARHSLLIFVALLLFGVLLHATTLSFSPLHWVDEVQINEIGRGGAFMDNREWDMVLFGDGSWIPQQSWAIYYLGGLIQEAGYQMFGHIGPRVMSLICLVLCVILLYFYLKKCAIDTPWVIVLCMILFSSPLMVLSVRGGRVDVLAFLFLFASLLTLQSYKGDHKREFWVYGTSTLFAVLMCFSWITGIVLLPLVLWEMNRRFQENRHGLTAIRLGVCVILVGLLTSLIFLLPFLISFNESLRIFLSVVDLNSSSKGIADPIGSIMKVFKYEFGFLVLGVAAWAFNWRNNAIALGGVVLFLFASIMTNVYEFRVLYLVPYTIIGLGLVIKKNDTKLSKIVRLLLLFYAMCFFGRSVLARNCIDFIAMKGRDYGVVQDEFEKVVGKNVRVYNNSFQLYYIGRILEWKQFRSVKNESLLCKEFWENIDFYITEKKLDDITAKNRGFRYLCKISPFEDLEDSKMLRGRFAPIGHYFVYKRRRPRLKD